MTIGEAVYLALLIGSVLLFATTIIACDRMTAAQRRKAGLR